MNAPSGIPPVVADRVAQALDQIAFGRVILVINDSRVSAIYTVEQQRELLQGEEEEDDPEIRSETL